MHFSNCFSNIINKLANYKYTNGARGNEMEGWRDVNIAMDKGIVSLRKTNLKFTLSGHFLHTSSSAWITVKWRKNWLNFVSFKN